MSLVVARAAPLVTVQDSGRRGLQHLAIPPGGAMDPISHRIANALVGNRDDAATLEIALSGPELEFDECALVALYGARFEATIDGVPFAEARPVLLAAGVRLRIGRAIAGSFGYLAVAGGFDVPVVLGSRATYLPGRFGGANGARIAPNVRLPVAVGAASLGARRFERITSRASSAVRSVRWFAPAITLGNDDPVVVRVVDGLHRSLFTDASRDEFLDTEWRVAPASNRMGYRLHGPTLELKQPTEIVSHATCLGTVQVPAGGQPIVLMVDHQTTGGYPRIAEVIAADVQLVAQRPPGALLRFQRVTLDEADAARERRSRQVDALVERILLEYGNEGD